MEPWHGVIDEIFGRVNQGNGLVATWRQAFGLGDANVMQI